MWENGEWVSLGSDLEPIRPMENTAVHAMVKVGGKLYVGGVISEAGGREANGMAVWDGCHWSPLGSGLASPGFRQFSPSLFRGVQALAVLGDYLYVGGDFLIAGGKPSPYFARIKIPTPAPVAVAVEIDAAVRVDFSTPNARFDYVLEQSANLRPGSWQPVPNASLESMGDLLRFTTARPAAGENYYRVAMVPPVYFTEDFENGAEGWTTTTTSGETHWELGTPAAFNLTEAHSGESVYGTDLDGPLTEGVASLRSPVIDLSGVDCAKLQFWYFGTQRSNARV